MNPNITPTHLLWTGGWDSTFRLLQLLIDYRKPVIPYYIIDTSRASTLTEIDTRHSIVRKIIERYPYTEELILAGQYFSLGDIKKNEDVSSKFKILKSEMHIGSQYDWLSRFAVQFEINNLELSIEKSDRTTHFKDTSIFKLMEDKSAGSIYKVDEQLPDSHPKSIFKPFLYPLLDFYKTDMKRHSIDKGYDDILNTSWFCFTPINGRPCGLCNPCRNVVVEGLGHRLPKDALFRNKYSSAYDSYAKMEKTAKRQIRKVFPDFQ